MSDAPSTRKGVIHLEAWEVELCKDAGVSLRAYATQKQAREKERIEHEKWLQTPAGAAYMAKRRAAYEKKLAKDRAYSRAYRAKKKNELSSHPVDRRK
jgi:hypothetical protein